MGSSEQVFYYRLHADISRGILVKLLEFEITEQSVQHVTSDTEITQIFKMQLKFPDQETFFMLTINNDMITRSDLGLKIQ